MNSVSHAALQNAPVPDEAALREQVERVLKTAPVNSGKRGLAEICTLLFGPISYRTIETRPLTWRLHNGKATTPTRPAVEAELQRFLASPKYRSGRTKETA
jgi:hypothetical protein